MIKLSKKIKALFASEPVKDEPKQEVKAEVTPQESPKQEEPAKDEPKAEDAPIEEKNMVACPNCKCSFAVDVEYEDPTKEEDAEVEDVKADTKDGDPIPTEEKKDDKVEEVKEEPKKEDTKAKALSDADWKSHFGLNTQVKPETLAFRNAIKDSFKL